MTASPRRSKQRLGHPPDFHASNWTDQEIGWALGRGVPVLPIRLGLDPYGFLGKIQGIPGSLENPVAIATSIVNVLMRNGQTKAQMRRALVQAFEHSDSFAMSKKLKILVVTIDDFTDEEKERLRNACVANNQVAGSWGVADAIYAKVGHPTPPATGMGSEVPF